MTRWTASFANQLQAGVNGIIAGTYSMIGVVVDGTGGASVTPIPGTVKVSGSLVGTTAPTPTPGGLGVLYRELMPIAWAAISVSGGAASLIAGANIASVTYNSAGNTTVTLNVGGNVNKLCPLATASIDQDVATAVPLSGTTIGVITRNVVGGARQDCPYYLLVYGAV